MHAKNHKTTEQTDSALSPATNPSWRFGELPAAELMPHLQRYLLAQDAKANWQLVWLNNDGRPVIGLLPKVSWSVYFNTAENQSPDEQSANYKVIRHCRDVETTNNADNSNAITTAYMSYEEWQNSLTTYSQAYETETDDGTSTTDITENPNYHHGLIGFIGYDIAAHELSPAANIELEAQPCAVLGHYDIYLSPKATNKTGWQLTVNTTANSSGKTIDDECSDKAVVALISYLDRLDKTLSDTCLSQKHLESSTPAPLILQARWHKRDYQQAFDRTQDYLQQGDCYQINLTQEWRGLLSHKTSNIRSISNLIDYLPTLYRNTQAPFAGYLSVNSRHDSTITPDIPTNPFELLSCSPELFFTFKKDANTGKHHIITKPIKGTMPRGATSEQDNRYKNQLSDSEKDRAENVMIVDLLRNDLGKYAKTGSVKVPQLFAIESFSNVHHMVSTITAELKENTHPLAVLFGSLPAGSITGTPKKRAVEIISELETAPRGAYCGTMGYMNFDGSGQWNVLIRTLQANTSSNNDLNREKHVSLWAGGGITVASDCDAEYQECLDKVGNLLSVLAQDNLSK
ncbi:anthranilate synthase component I family protein [Psychrobacter sp. NZS113]|uniref:anthranilate synthase component I family protein n=1 Tax=Psychrobacter sp. NZS113 TaxID=2792045 RepID=UPI0018CEA09D|nr:anthranilate synthase component I family protein [Psychrobacter sp. NZS113]MBH0097326.1 anthranilate synthase component I family protein [Psychrobacter sp. NZS113]